ncbi:MAG TPA: CpsD/CapB family tyrosine-protein kinase, partial [Ilumatobacteraceae bacterium]|nr:CpsD/CapB family tyrosine-protein kinase [Ilumatobacteraceae bacterium]
MAEHLRTIWNRRMIVVGSALIAFVAVFLWRGSAPATFEAQTGLDVSPAPSAQGTRPTGDDALFITEGYAERARTRPVLEAAIASAGLKVSVDDVDDRVTITTNSDSGSIEVTASGPSAGDAAALSDAVAAALVSVVQAEQSQAAAARLAPLRAEIDALASTLATLPLDDPTRPSLQGRHNALVAEAVEQELRPTDQLAVVSPADATSDSVAPRPVRDGVLAALVALVLSGELVVAFAALRDRFRSADLRADVSEVSGMPVLATVRRGSEAARREGYRELRTNLALMTPSFDAPSTIAVLGVDVGVGCTETAIELARAAAVGSQTVLLVDADLRRPAVHDRLGLPVTPGLAEVLAGAALTSAILAPRPGGPQFQVLPAGRALDDPVMALTEHLRERVLVPATQRARVTVIDTPPLSAVADAAAIAAQSDTTVLVIDARTTSRRAVRDILERLRQVGVMPLGVVVNNVTPRRSAISRRRRK